MNIATRLLLFSSASLFLQACVPNDMHVTYGLNPRNVDDDVRFRTTYYFRTFDYCWDANVSVKQLAGSGSGVTPIPVDYRRIIPQTDTLFRYKMTGKASALFSNIRFESGILKREEIDPFGSEVTYSADASGFYVRDRSEVKDAAEKANVRKSQLDRIDQMLVRYHSMSDTDRSSKDMLFAEVIKAVQSYLSGSSVTSAEASALEAKVSTLTKQFAAADATLAAELKALAAQATATASQGNELGYCPIGQSVRKGFQIMGPEGIKTFNQDERLVMAMSSSAKPLIETLQEYSGRILNSRADVSGQLIVLAQENARAEAARRVLSDNRRTKPKATPVLDDAIRAFGGEK